MTFEWNEIVYSHFEYSNNLSKYVHACVKCVNFTVMGPITTTSTLLLYIFFAISRKLLNWGKHFHHWICILALGEKGGSLDRYFFTGVCRHVEDCTICTCPMYHTVKRKHYTLFRDRSRIYWRLHKKRHSLLHNCLFTDIADNVNLIGW